MSPTPAQLNLLHHTLGLRPDQRNPFRNHFMAGPGHHDQPDLEALEAAGLMVRGKPPVFCDQSDVLFRVTDAGRALALDLLPQPPKRTRYEQFLCADCGLSFAEWLGIDRPRIEICGYFRPGGAVRMTSSRATGEWKPTRKEAKDSYKAVLGARRTSGAYA